MLRRFQRMYGCLQSPAKRLLTASWLLHPCCTAQDTAEDTTRCCERADHYTGLTERWADGEIWCSEVTGRLVCHICGVDPKWVRVLDMDTVHKLDGAPFHPALHAAPVLPRYETVRGLWTATERRVVRPRSYRKSYDPVITTVR